MPSKRSSQILLNYGTNLCLPHYSHIPSMRTTNNPQHIQPTIYFVNLDPTPVTPSFFAYPTIYCKNTAFSNRVRRIKKHPNFVGFLSSEIAPGREHLGNLRHDGVKKASWWCAGDSGRTLHSGDHGSLELWWVVCVSHLEQKSETTPKYVRLSTTW